MKKPPKTLRCTKTKYCDSITERSSGTAHKKGLSILNILHIPSGKIRVRIAMYKVSSTDRGLVLNFCPWCGFDFSKRTDRKYFKNEK